MVKANKCAFDQDSVEYLGHVIDKRVFIHQIRK